MPQWTNFLGFAAKLFENRLSVIANFCNSGFYFLLRRTQMFTPMARQIFVREIDAVSREFIRRMR